MMDAFYEAIAWDQTRIDEIRANAKLTDQQSAELLATREHLDQYQRALKAVELPAQEVERTVIVKAETLEAIYKIEGRPTGIPVLMDGIGNYFPIPPADWIP